MQSCRREEENKGEELLRTEKEEKIEKENMSNIKNMKKRHFTNSIGMKFILIPAGEFTMGLNYVSGGEKLVHKITIEKAYYLGQYPVTQKEWAVVMGSNPSLFKGANNPVEQVSWNDAQEFVRKLNELEGTDKYRLPSEAEWEYACRAGTTTKYFFGEDESALDEYGWYAGKTSHEVGQKKPNPWGLYDMYGNVWEWCQDKWHEDMENASASSNAWEDGKSTLRVDRGGCWSSLGRYCKSALRSANDPDNRYGLTGFRLLREL
jgi:formylglycine-generating enzyme required for sulfatase activity